MTQNMTHDTEHEHDTKDEEFNKDIVLKFVSFNVHF